ncbi:autotransporter outer membrane beta-barrel domain-containing protein [Snodgrassella gandavensis]|uniref:autotransporter outer membrane beta-barrel domain-containing protein n=1 Tax=Snodgrassella gandavensis TaxID=2946698 RepID=UPI001EF3E613|nr:autotransporter outer membrane beta-barrel domain-containing protein [Snodgrassella gandavensis]
MNRIYRLIWSALHQTWIAVGELTRAYKKTATVSVAIALSGMVFSTQAAAETQIITLPGDGIAYELQPLDDLDGITNTNVSKNGTDGKAAYIFQTKDGTLIADNPISVNSDVRIGGGNGGNGTDDDDGDGGDGGHGAVAISGDHLRIENNGFIGGGAGGEGGEGGYGKKSGNGGNGAVAINGNYLQVNNNGLISGGNGNLGGGYGGSGAVAIKGDHLKIDNQGSIKGGNGGYGFDGGNGGSGGAAINGDDLQIDNSGTLRGGSGGDGHRGDGLRHGGHGGTAIIGNNLTINNKNNGKIEGGYAGNNDYGGYGGYGGMAINGNQLTIENQGTIQGGDGGIGTVHHGGDGGMAINGNQLTINNQRTIQGGEGGAGDMHDDNGGDGGNGGIAINGVHLLIENSDIIQGGDGGYGGHAIDKNSGDGGNGAAAINGDDLQIVNSGTIKGGKGGKRGLIQDDNDDEWRTVSANDLLGSSGNGGNAISGSNLTIINRGHIIKGEKGDNSQGNTSVQDGAAIYLSAGNNSLTLKAGSDIQGDIVLASDARASNSLKIISKAETTINGNLKANDNTNVTLSGKQVSFSKNADFGNGTTLTFADGIDIKADKAYLHADKITFNNTNIHLNISNWDQSEITLASTDNGISGNYNDNTTTNSLLTAHAKDYVGLMLDNGQKNLKYGLKWFDESGDGHGIFDLREDATLNLNVNLTGNKSKNDNNWDGQSLTKKGLGTLQLSAKNTYSGATNIKKGTLRLAVADAIARTSEMNIKPKGILNLGGNNQEISLIKNQGVILINDLGASRLSNAVTVTGNMHNSGTLILNNCKNCTGQTYIQNGNWIGEGGTVQFGAILGDDHSITDKLQINGTATGTTNVQVMNEGRTGAQTIEGIELISTTSTTSDAFKQKGRIIAGSFEYHLQQGTNSGQNMNNWYLTSKVKTNSGDNPSDATGDGAGTGSSDADNSGGNSSGTGNNSHSSNKEIRVFRPEAGSYASNLAAANTLFSMRLHNRQGNGWYTDPVSGEKKDNSAWVRIVQGHNKNTMSDEQSKTTANRTVFQIGGDILAGSLAEYDQLHIGLTGGYAKQNSTTHNHLSGYHSDGKVEGYSAGIYATWYQKPHERNGAYVDSWILYNWFNNTVQGEQLAKEKYHSHGMSASLETGYDYHVAAYQLSADMQHDIYLRPQVQIQWSDVKANDHTERNGTRVYGKGNGNIQTRLGMRVSLDRHHQHKESASRIEPFAEINWLHNSKDYGVNMTDATTTIRGRHNMAEIKIGVEGQIKDNLRLWGNISQQLGKHDQRDTQGMAGIKYMF